MSSSFSGSASGSQFGGGAQGSTTVSSAASGASQKVTKVDTFGEVPLARFGHMITQVSKTKVILFGGATGDTGKYVITGDTYTMDMLNMKWHKLEGAGFAPSPRAAHGQCAVDQLQMVVYGGATGGGGLAPDDLYLLDLRNGESMAQWMIVPVIGQTPGRRYGHTIVSNKPYLLVFGGNTGSEPVNDVWCLNVDKAPFSWMKLETPGDSPQVRVYHSAAMCSMGSATGMMVVFGGRTADQSALKDTWGLRRHRDGRWDWIKAPYKGSGEEPLARYQHATLFLGTLMVVLGGRSNSASDNIVMEIYETETSEWRKFSSVQRFRASIWSPEPQTIFMYGGFENDAPNVPTNTVMKLDMIQHVKGHAGLVQKLEQASLQATGGRKGGDEQSGGRPVTPPMQSLSKNQMKIQFGKTEIESKKGLVQQVVNEKERKAGGKQVESLSQLFLNHLLRPKEWSASVDGQTYFAFRREHILALADEAQKVLETQPMVLRVDAPVKVFGDIHGQYQDLMRFFDLWKQPDENGDIESYDYLFLGDYVDRGNHSLETICLLMALKIRFPNKIHLLRGNHEDKCINNAFGFAEECSNRLGEDPIDHDSVFNKINDFFDWLPLAAVIEDRIVCLHGGIGSTLVSLEQIEQIRRPLEVVHEVSSVEQQLVVDILWSDPTDSDSELGIQPNFVRDPNGTGNIVKFGPDRVKNFLENNKMSFILRAHECVMDGFERFAGGCLFTVFSATDYCGRHKNAGAMLQITKSYELVPKMIYPLNNAEDNWITDDDQGSKRPPTPPRWQNQGPRAQSFD